MHIDAQPIGKGHVYRLKISRLKEDYPSSTQCALQHVRHGKADRTVLECTGVKVRDWARVMNNYIRPHMKVQSDVFFRPDHKCVHELVIHMRGEDVMGINHVQMRHRGFYTSLEETLSPCALYDWVILYGNEGGRFCRVRVVTKDRLNPCVAAVISRHSASDILVTVQSKSREVDAATLMNARYLVVAQSFFSIVMAQMNLELRTLYFLAEPEIRRLYPEGFVPCRDGGPRIVAISAPGAERFESRTNVIQRSKWMVHYPINNISVVQQRANASLR